MPEFLVRGEEPPSTHGADPRARPVREHLDLGCVFLDKPSGPTSHQAVAWLRDLLELPRAGHAGTLDPNVSGVLTTALGRATKALEALKGDDKEYVAVLRLHRPVERARLEAVLREFVGEIYQMPPAKAAVARRLRRRTIHAITPIEFDPEDRPTTALIRVACDAGTYIRKLCVDVGLVVGATGHMEDLRRTRSGRVPERDAVPLHEVKDAYDHWKESKEEEWLRGLVRPVEQLLSHVPRVTLRAGAVDAICHGAPLHAPGVLELQRGIVAGETVVLTTTRGEAVALARAGMDAVQAVEARTGVVARPTGVLMAPGTYPKGWTTAV